MTCACTAKDVILGGQGFKRCDGLGELLGEGGKLSPPTTGVKVPLSKALSELSEMCEGIFSV